MNNVIQDIIDYINMEVTALTREQEQDIKDIWNFGEILHKKGSE